MYLTGIMCKGVDCIGLGQDIGPEAGFCVHCN
jgi:hypothetical protein